MNKKQLKQQYRRFCHWQQRGPHCPNRHEGEVRQCNNCGTEFADNFCPRCGQRAEMGRVGWKSIKENIAILWGLDSRSLIYTLVQLLARPGYLVRDYISGHRQVSFPPVKMLVIVCIFVVFFETVFHVKNDVLPILLDVQQINEAIKWLNSQKSWATLLVQSFCILPTWMVFRYAPAYPRHTLPEGFFLQVFLSVQALLLGFFGYWSTPVESVLCFAYMYITYRQLFGYSWWGTLWRFFIVLLSQFVMLITTICMVYFVYEGSNHTDKHKTFLVFIATIATFAALSAVFAVMFYVIHLINKRTFNKRKNPGAPAKHSI